MNDQEILNLPLVLKHRRKALNMPVGALVKRSGVSKATIFRLFSSRPLKVRLDKVLKVAEALGVTVKYQMTSYQMTDPEEFIKKQAEYQARRMVDLANGTMGLEAQAVGPEQLCHLVENSKKRILQGPRKKLWY